MFPSMIYDRTQEDITEASRIFETKVRLRQELTEEEKEQLQRGYLMRPTLNRIESACEFLSSALSDYGYLFPPLTTKIWEKNGFMCETDYARVIDNVKRLYSVYPHLPDSPTPPDYLFGYKELNAIEKILDDINVVIGRMEQEFIYSSDYVFTGSEGEK